MADRPIIFSAPMVLALLAGRKTQTRRLLKRPGALAVANAWGAKTMSLPENADLLRYHVGDRLYVREQWSAEHRFRGIPIKLIRAGGGSDVWYWADGDPEFGDWTKPKPSIHMPRWASRLTLTVTDVRVQRLQEISDQDAQAEGMTFPEGMKWGADPVDAFSSLWDSLHGAGAWEANPAVVVLTFTVDRRNIDQEPTP